MLAPSLWRTGLLCLTACAAVEPPRTVPRPDAAQLEALQAAERLYREQSEDFAAARDALAADPVTAFWLTRMLVLDVVRGLDAAQSTDHDFLATVAEGAVVHPVFVRALTQLEALGAAAVPAVAEDLLRHRYSDRRRLGVDVLASMGPAVLPALSELLDDPDWRTRNHVMAVLLAMPAAADPEAVAPLIERGLRDPEFAVRASAVRALPQLGPEAAPRLRALLVDDPDAYVRRSAATVLGEYPDRDTARALVEFYGVALADGDHEAVRAADDSLRRIAGRRDPGDLGFWRAWLVSWEGR